MDNDPEIDLEEAALEAALFPWLDDDSLTDTENEYSLDESEVF